MCGKFGMYSILAVMAWEKYLAERIQSIHEVTSQLFKYQETNEKIEVIAEKLKTLSKTSDQQVAAIVALLEENPSMTKMECFPLCKRYFSDLFDIVESSFNKPWAEARKIIPKPD